MSKKVVRLTESQLRLMINKVINEQKTPVASQKGKTQQGTVKPELNYEDGSPKGDTPENRLLLQEALKYASQNIFAYASEYKPGFIACIFKRNTQFTTLKKGSLLDAMPETYGAGIFGSHQFDLTLTQVSKSKGANKTSIQFNINVLADGYQVGGTGGVQYIPNSITWKEAYDLFSKKRVGIQIAKVYSGTNREGVGSILYQLMVGAGVTAEQGYQLLARAVPDIGGQLIDDLVSMEYWAGTREEKYYLQKAMDSIQKLIGQQQQQQQQQQPVNENKKRRV